MHAASRYALGFLSLVLLTAGTIAFARQFVEGEALSYALPCALLGAGLFAGIFAWKTGIGLAADSCMAQSDSSEHGEGEVRE
jgi:hypothetical protein